MEFNRAWRCSSESYFPIRYACGDLRIGHGDWFHHPVVTLLIPGGVHGNVRLHPRNHHCAYTNSQRRICPDPCPKSTNPTLPVVDLCFPRGGDCRDGDDDARRTGGNGGVQIRDGGGDDVLQRGRPKRLIFSATTGWPNVLAGVLAMVQSIWVP